MTLGEAVAAGVLALEEVPIIASTSPRWVPRAAVGIPTGMIVATTMEVSSGSSLRYSPAENGALTTEHPASATC